MTLPITAKKITNLYLYGQESTPTDLTYDSILYHQAAAPLQFDTQEFMTAGPGQFARPSQSDLVNAFFQLPLSTLDPELDGASYLLSELELKAGIEANSTSTRKTPARWRNRFSINTQ